MEEIKSTIDANITPNGEQGITGSVLNRVLNDMVDATEGKLAQLDQELESLKARVAALENGGGGGGDEPTRYYTLNASVENGSVLATKDGEIVELPLVAESGAEVILEVAADEDYQFNAWEDGNADNPRTIIVNGDLTLSAICEYSLEIPTEYRLLRGISTTSNNTYFSLSEPIDSHSNYDLYFGSIAESNNSNLPLFGIRRTSGLSDTSANCIYFNNSSTYKPYAWVSGGVDAQLDASGYGVVFNGNMHKLSQRGNDLYEWDRLIAHREQDFINQDGVPAFFGNLGKTASSAYSYQSSNAIFYRFVAYDSQMNKTRDFRPVVRVDDGKLGVYDVITGLFNAAVGTWMEYTSEDVAKITLEAQVAKGTPTTTAALQSSNYYKGYWVNCHDRQQNFTIVKGQITNDGEIHFPPQQVLTCEEYNTNWHGNTSWLSAQKWDDTDFFPLLYVSTDRGNKLLAVYRIKGSNPDALEGIELVQKISIESSLFFNNFYSCAKANTFIHYGYTQDSYSSSDNGNTILLQVYKIPDAKAGDIALTSADALTEPMDIGFGSAGGDGYWTGKYFGIPFHTNNGEFKVFKVNDDCSDMEVVYSIPGLHTNGISFVTTSEIETMKFTPYFESWLLTIEPLNSGRLNFLDYSPLKQFEEIVEW